MRVALVHDYLTQRGGAERVVLALADAFPDAPIYTSLYRPQTTFDEFRGRDVRVSWLDHAAPLRRFHRAAFPLLAPAFSSLEVDADVVVCSSSGWAHGVRVTGRKVVYCHSPAKWLYRPDEYFRGTRWAGALGRLASGGLRAWDRRAAASADVYIANSTAIAAEVEGIYRLRAEVVPPPLQLDASGPQAPVPGVEPGYFLCVSRLLPYKNVGVLLDAFTRLPDERLVVVGGGPLLGTLAARAPANAELLGTVSDDSLRWLYANAFALLAPAHEDFGLTPVEAAAFGRPTAALRAGGYLDTVLEGETGVFFDRAEPRDVVSGVADLRSLGVQEERLVAHAATFAPERFRSRIAELVDAVRPL